jgi:hypothetical protein
MINIFAPNITITEIKTDFGITSPDAEVGAWLGRMANLMVNFGISSYFELTEITEELAFDKGFVVSQSLVEILETKLKYPNNNLLEIDKSYFTFSKYDFYTRLSNCQFGQNFCSLPSSLGNHGEIFNDALGTDLYNTATKTLPFEYIVVKYKTGIDLTDTSVKADFIKVLGVLYSEFGLNFAPNYFNQKGNGNLKKWQVDGTMNEFSDISQTRFDKNFFLSRLPIVARILAKYVGSQKYIF